MNSVACSLDQALCASSKITTLSMGAAELVKYSLMDRYQIRTLRVHMQLAFTSLCVRELFEHMIFPFCTLLQGNMGFKGKIMRHSAFSIDQQRSTKQVTLCL